MIYHDHLAKIWVVLSLCFTIWLATYQTLTVIIFPAIILMAGLLMEWYLNLTERRKPSIVEISTPNLIKTIYFTAISVFGMFLTGIAVDYVQYPASLAVASFDSFAYTNLMAISEEVFFRGFVTDALLTYTPKMRPKIKGTFWRPFSVVLEGPGLPLIISALIFMFYHWARYSTDLYALIYVFIGGFLLSYVAYKSKVLSPAISGHMINNTYAWLRKVLAQA